MVVSYFCVGKVELDLESSTEDRLWGRKVGAELAVAVTPVFLLAFVSVP